ncbi:hypothetical protein XENOCAPTIV_011387, partial [Xenoophorus captivus]
WQVGGPGRFMRRSLLMVCGLSGGSGQNALKPVEWVCPKGAGSVYPLLHLLRPLLTHSLHQTGRIIFLGASEDLLYHLGALTIPLVTLGNAHLITLHQSLGVIILDCLYIETHPLVGKGLLASTIRPGQFGYGKVPFSLPLHRTHRQARHTVNGTDEAPRPIVAEGDNQKEEDTEREEVDREEERTENGEQKISVVPAAEEEPIPTESIRQHVGRTSHSEHSRSRVLPKNSFSRSSTPSVFVNRQRFDWNSVTAPPPPQSQPRSPGNSPLFTSPLHRPNSAHIERKPHPGFGPQAPPAGSVYPLQHPHMSSQLGLEASRQGAGEASRLLRCSGPEKQYRRCFSQVGLSDSFQLKSFRKETLL